MLRSLRILKDRFDIYEGLCRNLFKRFKILIHVKLAIFNCKTTQILKVQCNEVLEFPTLPKCAAQGEVTPLKNRGSSSIKIGGGGG